MATKNDENWMMHYNELKAYVAVHFLFKMSHLGDKNNKLAIFTGQRQTSVDEFLRFSRKCGIDGT